MTIIPITTFGMNMDAVLWVLVELWLKGFLLLSFTAICLIAQRRQSASFRHLILSTGLLSMALLPFTVALPATPRFLDLHGLIRGQKRHDDYVLIRPAEPAALTPVSNLQNRPVPRYGPVASSGRKDSEPPLSVGFIIVSMWLLGVLLLLVRRVIDCRKLATLERSSEPIDNKWNAVVGRIGSAMAISRPVRVLISGSIKVPITTGIIRPVIVLPPTLGQWSPSRRENVLRHELAHVKRWDTLTEAITGCALALHWLNPFVWIIAAWARTERERACDDQVLANGTKPSDYADDLVKMVAESSYENQRNTFAIAYCSEFPKRIRAILDPSRSRGAASLWTVLLSVFLCAALVLGASLVTIRSPQVSVFEKTKVGTATEQSSKSIHETIRTGTSTDVKEILQNHPEFLNLPNDLGQTPLMVALLPSSKNGSEIAKMLISAGADVNAPYKGWTPLILAAEHGDTVLMKLLLDKGANVSARNIDERTALDVAAYPTGNKEAANLLISSGATVNIIDAVFLGDLERVRTMLEQNPKLVNARQPSPPVDSLEAALIRRANTGDNQIVELVLKYNPGIDFWKAAALGKADLVLQLLREQPTLVNEKHHLGMSALDWAVAQDQEETASILLQRGATANSRMLAAAIRAGNSSMVRLLISYHANPNELIPGQGTPYGIALRLGRKDLVELLKQF